MPFFRQIRDWRGFYPSKCRVSEGVGELWVHRRDQDDLDRQPATEETLQALDRAFQELVEHPEERVG